MPVAYGEDIDDDFRRDAADIQKATLTGTGKTYYPLRPGFYTTVTLNKAGSTATLKTSNDYSSGNVDDATFSTLKQSESTTDYQGGHNAGLTGLELDITTYVADVEITILQYKLNNE